MLRVLMLTMLLLATLVPSSGEAQRAPVILSTTTSTQDSGLLDVLVPMFERQTGYAVKTIAVGTGQALTLAARGEADVVLAHAPALEKKYVAEGKMLNRRLVMYNDFVIIGPAEDPAKVKGVKKAADALKAIADASARFVSRGDNSGTHVLEKSLWTLAGVEAGWRLVHRVWAGDGRDPGHRRRPEGLHDHRPRDLSGVSEARAAADSPGG